MDRHVTVISFEDLLLPHLVAAAPGAHVIDVSHLRGCRLACEPDTLEALRAHIHAGDVRGAVLLGSGDFHYVTRLLLERVHEPFSLVLFDNHSDYLPRHFASSLMACDSWVGAAMELPLLRHLCLVGVDPETVLGLDLEAREDICYAPYDALDGAAPEAGGAARWSVAGPIRDKGIEATMREVLARIPTDAIYISVDKDVLHPDDAVTNWSHGEMRLDELAAAIAMLVRERRLVGMDVTGEARLGPLDQFSGSGQSAIAKNQRANRVLLEAAGVLRP